MGSQTVLHPRVLDPGYRAPDTQPEDFICTRVYIPDDTLHIAAFWGNLFLLTQWLSWERGGTKAKDSADTWKIAYDMSRDWFDLYLGVCEIPKPVQQDPTKEVADVVYVLKILIQEIDQLLRVGFTASQLKTRYAAIIAYVPGIADMIDSMAAVNEATRATAISAASWQDIYNSWWCNRDECHLENFEYYQVFTRDWTACLIRNIEEWASGGANLIEDWSADFINGALPDGFLSLINSHPNGGNNLQLTPNACGWTHVFEFATSAEGWYRAYKPTYNEKYFGELFAGYWRQTVGHSGSSWILSLEIQLDLLPVSLTTVVIRVHGNTSYTYPIRGIDLNWLDSAGVQHTLPDQTYAVGDNNYTFTLNLSNVYGLYATLYSVQSGAEPPVLYPSDILSITVSGTGTNPFE